MIFNLSKLKSIIPLVMVLICFKVSYSQDIKYDDLIEESKQLSAKQRYNRFFEYQKQDPHFSNTYIQLGDACEKIFLELDPLRDLQLINHWANNAILYYGLYPVYLKSNEVRRNREYYTNLPIKTDGSKIENEDVLAYVESRLNFCRNYKDSLVLIFKALEISKDHYNTSVKIFNDLNNQYDNLNQALLKTDSYFLDILDSLDKEYSRAVGEFENYQKMIKTFPIGNYKQEFKLIPIQTFRLDGLTNSNFLNNSFHIWDYGKWVSDFKKIFNAEIVTLRNEIESINKTFNDNKRRLLIVESVEEGFTLGSYDDLFMFRLGKFDNNSLVRDLFRYLNIRQDFLINSKSSLNLVSDSTVLAMNRKFRYYHGLAMHKVQAQEMLNYFSNAIDQEKTLLFNDFFNKNYQGVDGLKDFYSLETIFLTQTLEKSFENLKTYLNNVIVFQNSLGNATGSRGVVIPLKQVSIEDGDNTKLTYLTQSVYWDQGAPRYLAGHINRKGKKPMAFVAKVTDDKTVEWTKEIGNKGKLTLPNGDKTEVIYGFDKGLVCLVSGEADTTIQNTLVRLDAEGNEIISQKVPVNHNPCFIKFDEINQKTLMAFSEPENDSSAYISSITICQADSIGEIIWESSFGVHGELVDIIKTGEKHLAIFNFKNYQWNDTKIENEIWGALILEIDENGNTTKATPIKSSYNFHISKTFTVSKDEISLIGYASEPNSNEGKLLYLIIDPNGELKFENF